MDCVCIICNGQENADDKLRNPNSGLEKIAEYGKLFGRSGVLDYLKTIDQKNVKIHVSCQKRIGNEIRKKQRNGEKDDEPTVKMQKRSEVELFYYNIHCLFCGKTAVEDEIARHPDRQGFSFSYPKYVDSKHLLEICGRPDRVNCQLTHTVRGRLQAINDIVAEKSRYHRSCYRDFCREDVPSDEAPAKRSGRPANEKQSINFAKLCKWLDLEAELHTVAELRDKMVELAGGSEDVFCNNAYLKKQLLDLCVQISWSKQC